jgi:hypothetical protein
LTLACTLCDRAEVVVAVSPGSEPVRAVSITIDAGEPQVCYCARCWWLRYGGPAGASLPSRILP